MGGAQQRDQRRDRILGQEIATMHGYPSRAGPAARADAMHLRPVCQERADDGPADEAGGTRHQEAIF